MRDGLLRRSEASALRWGEVELHEDGSGRLHVARSKTDQSAEGAVLYLGPPAAQALLAIRPEQAVIDPVVRVFELSVSQISRRIEAATKIAGLGEGVQRPFCPRGHSPGPERRRDGAAGAHDLGEVGQSHDAGEIHRGPGDREGRGGQVLPGRCPEVNFRGGY